MNIKLNKVLPHPLASIQHSEDSIWGNDVILKEGAKILLNASSGKGKSTFTTTVFGLRKDYEGNVFYDQKNIRDLNIDEWTLIRRKTLSVVFQDLQLFPELTVKENLLLKNNLSGDFSDEQLKEMLTQLGIPDKWEQQCGLLSMGQQQRVAIIRALIQPFKWLLMDEPFSHLDKKNTTIALDMIIKRCDELNAGFVLTTLGDHHGIEYDYELKL